jgi:hypothetical protein
MYCILFEYVVVFIHELDLLLLSDKGKPGEIRGRKAKGSKRKPPHDSPATERGVFILQKNAPNFGKLSSEHFCLTVGGSRHKNKAAHTANMQ